MDPLTTGLIKAAGTAGEEAAKESGRLLNRILGPSADVIGEALSRYTEERVKNVGRIAEKAAKKSRGQADDGVVPPRVAHRILEEGSYCDDELMAEYLGGVMAGGRTPTGRDDRAVVWAELVSGLSALQIRAHFLLYREWARRLQGMGDLNLGVEAGRNKSVIHVELAEFIARLSADSGVDPIDANAHSIHGLVRSGLLSDHYGYGPKDQIGRSDSDFDALLYAHVTTSGLELYGWAQGEPGITPGDFPVKARPFADDEIPPLRQVRFPKLDAPG